MIIRLPDASELEVKLDSRHERISVVRGMVADRMKVQPEEVRLIGLGKILKDQSEDGELTFMDYGINKNFTLIAMKCEIVTTTPKEDIVEKAEEMLEDNNTLPLADGELPSDVDRCSACKKKPSRKCRECNCNVCGLNKDANLTLGCDECGFWFHTYCQHPQVTNMPDSDEDWYCSNCQLDRSKVLDKDSNKASTSKRAQKDALWKKQKGGPGDKGQANAGVQKCTLLPTDFIGKIPGVPVGSSWSHRVLVAASGVHRPPVSGMHGSEKKYAYSIVSSHGYEDDIDEGDRLIYTGAGGRGDLGDGNRRTGNQVVEQTLARTNLALAKNCAAFNAKTAEQGADAGDSWRRGIPVRVVRGVKNLKKRGKFCPEFCGFRYDGLYKVKRYFSEKGQEGFPVWKYELLRDDEEPSPWSEEGIERIRKLGLVKESVDAPTQNAENTVDENGEKKKKAIKRKAEEESAAPIKIPKYEMPTNLHKLMSKDVERNQRKWTEIFEGLRGYKDVVNEVKETFKCVVCQDLLIQPVTFPCGDSMCLACLNKMIQIAKRDLEPKTELVLKCQTCQIEIPKSVDLKKVNTILLSCIDEIMPGWKDIKMR